MSNQLSRKKDRSHQSPQDVYTQLQGLLRPEQSLHLLKQLHILTQEGRINQDSRRKLKQVMHLAQFIERLLPLSDLGSNGLHNHKDLKQSSTHRNSSHPFHLVDLGAGKSYLGFILYDLFFKNQPQWHIHAVEMRPELVEKTQKLALDLQFERLGVIAASVQEAKDAAPIPVQVDVVTALHACNTATDDAIEFGLAKGARHIVLVPCCQAEVSQHLKKIKHLRGPSPSLTQLWRHNLHSREFGSHLTNVLRCLYLESQGYEVSVTELVGWEHSMKNELIVASKKSHSNSRALKHLESLLNETCLMPVMGHRFGLPASGSALPSA